MKNILKYIPVILVTGVLLLTGACNESDFLDRYPLDKPSPDNFFVGAASARQAVNACYHGWARGDASMVKRDMILALDAMTDDSGWRPARAATIAQEQWDLSPTHGALRSYWNQVYASINAANFAIDNISLSTDPSFTAEQQAPYIAEAKFLRAYSYLFLTTFFGDIPLLTSAASDFEEFHTPVSTREQIMVQVVEDFTYAKNNLPQTQTLKGAPPKAAAAAFLAKAYLYVQQWSNAETEAREAVQLAESNGYKLQDDYLSIWSEDDNPELLFYWTFVHNDPVYGQNMTVERLIRDLPAELKTINGSGWGYALPQRDLYDAFEDGDPRREYTIYSPGHDYANYNGTEDFTYIHKKYNEQGEEISWEVTYKPGDMVEYDHRWSPTGLNVRKMTRSIMDIANARWSGLDVPVLRMAEVYLVLAEALAEQGDVEALTWVNKVRARASVNMPPKLASDGDLVDLVRHERRVELAMEGLRVYDLVRWGTLKEVFGDGTKVKSHIFSEFISESSSYRYDDPIGNLEMYALWPIPQSEIDNNTEINTNSPGW